MNGDVGLAVDAGGEVLGGRCGDGGVALDDFRDSAAERFDAERERCHVEQQHLFSGLGGAGENVGLHGRAEGNDFVGIEFDVRLLAACGEMEEIVDQLADGGNARGAADQDDFVDLFGRDAGIGRGPVCRGRRCGRGRARSTARRLRGNLALIAIAVGQFDVEAGDVLGGEGDLGVDGGLAQGLHGARVLAQIDAVLGVNFVERDGEEQVVDVVAAEVRVAVGGLHLEDAVVELENGDVEGAAAEIVDGDGAVLGAIEAVGERCGGGLVDEAKHFKAGHAACVLGGLALRIVEVGGDGDDGLGDRRAEEALGVALELAQNVGGDFRRSEAQFAELNARDFAGFDVVGKPEGEELQFALDFFEAAAHEALDGVDDALRSLDEHAARAVADGDGGPAAVGRHGVERHDGRHEV